MAKNTTSATSAQSGNHVTVKPSQFKDVLAFCDKAGLVAFVMSPPGVGKSDLIRQYAEETKRRYYDIRLAYSAPTDLQGFPYIDRENNRMKFSLPNWFPTEPGNVLALEEFSCASKMVQNGSLQLTLDRRIGDHVLPENTLTVLAGNGASHRVHVERLSSAVANRIMFIHLVPDLDDWTEWALAAGVDVRLVAFLRFRPDLLHSFDPAKWDGETGFATPRSWAAAARLVASEPPAYLRHPMLEGLVGPGPAAELNAFLTIYEQLPSIDGILLDPKGSDVPEEPSARYAVCAALANKAEKGNFNRVTTYLGRLPKEFEVFGVRLTVRTKKEVLSSKDFITWAVDNKDVML